jgi:CHAT domain-containing protein
VALGDPAYGAPPAAGMRGAPADAAEALPLSRAEVEEVAARFPPEERTLLLGADATGARLTQTLRDAAPRVRAVHLACHAVIDPAHPRLSGLVLAGGETFSLFDVATQRVDADLVTLSACGTARGRLIRGEGPLGLVYGFFLAGASRVLATAWHVEDASTRALLVRVYDGWLKDGLSVAAALRRAQREQIAAGGPLAHPYHWAAFTLWGLP